MIHQMQLAVVQYEVINPSLWEYISSIKCIYEYTQELQVNQRGIVNSKASYG